MKSLINYSKNQMQIITKGKALTLFNPNLSFQLIEMKKKYLTDLMYYLEYSNITTEGIIRRQREINWCSLKIDFYHTINDYTYQIIELYNILELEFNQITLNKINNISFEMYEYYLYFSNQYVI
jgi:hypothetical protein